jgi:hypothetical protein
MSFDGDDGDDDGWVLSGDAWTLVLAAAEHAVDDYSYDLESLRAGTMLFADTSMYQVLPPLQLARYDAAFAEAFVAATSAVTAKLRRAHGEAWPYPTEALLGCVGEELAMEAILAEAEIQADIRLESGALSASGRARLMEDVEMLREVSFKDRDFEFLFDPQKDGGVEDPGLQAQMGFMNLTFADWFSPFWEDDDPFSPA